MKWYNMLRGGRRHLNGNQRSKTMCRCFLRELEEIDDKMSLDMVVNRAVTEVVNVTVKILYFNSPERRTSPATSKTVHNAESYQEECFCTLNESR